MPKLTVNGREVEVPAGHTVLQACEAAGVEIPRFCYHERLSIAGNCRMCLVHMEKSPKPIASCAMPAADGMVIRTDTPEIRKARQGVMELLLINHPLDCPICDQGGECDLQDQAMAYGFDRGRYRENRRAVKDKNWGPLIKTVMTRCIHCTRCIRFATEIAGVPDLGATGRGENMEVGMYVEKALNSELSGNLIDLCPVGALTSAPYAFACRSWELRKTESIDVLDAVGSNIRIDSRGPSVLRILPRLNEDVNEEWIADKTRFACDGLRHRRLDQPWVRRSGRLEPATWTEAFDAVAKRLKSAKPDRVAALAGDLADAESMFLLKTWLAKIGTPHMDCRQDGAKLDPSRRAGYLFNTTIARIERADVCLLIGANPRREAPIVNARLRKRWLMGGFSVAAIGEPADLTYRVERLGPGAAELKTVATGKHPFAKTLAAATAPMLVVGQGALARPDGGAVLALAREIAEKSGLIKPESKWNGFNVLHTAASRVGGLDLGFVPGPGGRDTDAIVAGAGQGAIEVLFLLGADEIDTRRLGSTFVVYVGHHGDAGAARADVVLPAAAYTEKDATYVNTEGRVQRVRRAAFPSGDAREDWTIVRALAEACGMRLPFDRLADVRAGMAAVNPVFAEIDVVRPAPWGVFGAAGSIGDAPFRSPIADYYRTDPISRASPTMAECATVFSGTASSLTGTHG
jgi:NADH-quinone oxidoreductase subunit G